VLAETLPPTDVELQPAGPANGNGAVLLAMVLLTTAALVMTLTPKRR
jgi:hypothetical protein